jgi:phosphoesterase RecJ-like protein
MNDGLLTEIRSKFLEAKRILVVSHIRPDGDAVGSLLGLGLALQASGKEVQMVLSDKLPAGFRHLPGSEQVRVKAEGVFDLVVALDCSDLARIGEALTLPAAVSGSSTRPVDINIDHHFTNLRFGAYNLVESDAAATSEIIAQHLSEFGLSLSQPVAETLLTGILTDTLGFCTSNMSPNVLRVAANLMEAGANLPDLYHNALMSRSFDAARYWGAGLSRLQREGPIVWAALTLEDRHTVGYPGRDDADLINVISSIDDAEVSLVFIEQNHATVKVSWRAQPGYDVSLIALRFGGGGHKSAAGAEIPGALQEVQKKVIEATRSLFTFGGTSG